MMREAVILRWFYSCLGILVFDIIYMSRLFQRKYVLYLIQIFRIHFIVNIHHCRVDILVA
jgi:hypothetical protein